MVGEDYIFNIENFFWSFLTFGWIAYILFTVGVVVIFISIIYIFKDYKLISFIFREKWRFVKNYLYLFTEQKIVFLKSYMKEVYKVANKQRLLIITISILVIIGICIYIFIQVIKNKSG